RVAAMRRRIESGRLRAQHRDNLFRDLDEARMAMASIKHSHFDFAGAAVKNAAAFAGVGLEIQTGQTEALAPRIRDEEPGVRDGLIVALDYWAYCAMQPEKMKLLAIARAADRDTWRRDYRNAVVKRDAAALVRLSKEARGGTLSPTGFELLAYGLRDCDRLGEAIDLLRWARERHPTDFWIAFDLGNYLLELRQKA